MIPLEFSYSLNSPLSQRTLCFLVQGDKVLLGKKKRGLGEGLYLGIGGKIEKDETTIDAAIREVQEEIGVTVSNLIKVAETTFLFPKNTPYEKWNQQVHSFLTTSWQGEIRESAEMMLPEWFSQNNLPFTEAWDDMRYWLPRVLKGEKLEACFYFNQDLKVQDYEIINKEKF